MFKFTVKTQQQCINISILLWQHFTVLLDHLQANIQRYEVQSVYIIDVLLLVHIMNALIVPHISECWPEDGPVRL